MDALLLIGGEGTRLRPLSLSVPKSLAPVVDKPLLEHIILWLKKYGVKNVNLAVCYKPDKLKKVFGSGKKLGVNIRYIHETKPLGTGGAIKNARRFIKNTAVMFNGDVITDINLGKVIDFHRSRKAIFTDVLVPVDDPSAFGLVRTERDGKILEFLEKPKKNQIKGISYINAGIYVVEPELFSYIPANVNVSIEKETFPLLIKEKQNFYGYKVSKPYWIDVGTPERYMSVQFDIISKKIKINKINSKEIKNKVWIGKNSSFHSKKSFIPPVYMGNNCKIAKNAFVKNSCLGSNVIVKEGASIENSIIWDNSIIGKGVKLNGCILGYSCVIGDYASVGSGIVLGESSKITSYSKL